MIILALFVPALFFPYTAVVMAYIIGTVATIELYKALKKGGYNPPEMSDKRVLLGKAGLNQLRKTFYRVVFIRTVGDDLDGSAADDTQ